MSRRGSYSKKSLYYERPVNVKDYTVKGMVETTKDYIRAWQDTFAFRRIAFKNANAKNYYNLASNETQRLVYLVLVKNTLWFPELLIGLVKKDVLEMMISKGIAVPQVGIEFNRYFEGNGGGAENLIKFSGNSYFNLSIIPFDASKNMVMMKVEYPLALPFVFYSRTIENTGILRTLIAVSGTDTSSSRAPIGYSPSGKTFYKQSALLQAIGSHVGSMLAEYRFPVFLPKISNNIGVSPDGKNTFITDFTIPVTADKNLAFPLWTILDQGFYTYSFWSSVAIGWMLQISLSYDQLPYLGTSNKTNSFSLLRSFCLDANHLVAIRPTLARSPYIVAITLLDGSGPWVFNFSYGWLKQVDFTSCMVNLSRFGPKSLDDSTVPIMDNIGLLFKTIILNYSVRDRANVLWRNANSYDVAITTSITEDTIEEFQNNVFAVAKFLRGIESAIFGLQLWSQMIYSFSFSNFGQNNSKQVNLDEALKFMKYMNVYYNLRGMLMADYSINVYNSLRGSRQIYYQSDGLTPDEYRELVNGTTLEKTELYLWVLHFRYIQSSFTTEAHRNIANIISEVYPSANIHFKNAMYTIFAYILPPFPLKANMEGIDNLDNLINETRAQQINNIVQRWNSMPNQTLFDVPVKGDQLKAVFQEYMSSSDYLNTFKEETVLRSRYSGVKPFNELLEDVYS